MAGLVPAIGRSTLPLRMAGTSPAMTVGECAPPLLVVTGAYGLRGSRILNSLYSPTLLSTAMLPPCCFVTIS